MRIHYSFGELKTEMLEDIPYVTSKNWYHMNPGHNTCINYSRSQ